ncbi:type IX secretion system protein PorG [Aegicerativicinus sediminis]|uniref:type IX secretion system protein PorG n=1 Tax=Aegicerativicinus sediminis TaxID=2893202 RepID=UPI001E488265|nr:DUF6089 family protein [Aegicerativicinus sediminis]
MRYLLSLLVSILCVKTVSSQIYEVGVFGGGSNVIGDVGRTNYISPNQVAYGAILKWNRSERHAYRISFIYADIVGEDKLSDDPRRKQRNYRFSDGIFEISAGMEFTFWEYNLHEPGNQLTPYLYTGISVANHDNHYFDFNGNYIDEGVSSWAWGIPMVLGVKARILPQTVLGFEIGARYTTSDELDGSVPESSDRQQYRFGNLGNNDWYMFTGFTVTYTFGQRPCYCDY